MNKRSLGLGHDFSPAGDGPGDPSDQAKHQNRRNRWSEVLAFLCCIDLKVKLRLPVTANPRGRGVTSLYLAREGSSN
jgi:hypothetical protein